MKRIAVTSARRQSATSRWLSSGGGHCGTRRTTSSCIHRRSKNDRKDQLPASCQINYKGVGLNRARPAALERLKENMISGTDILIRSLSKPAVTDRHGNHWNYHSQSDHHSKVACWGIVFDLLRTSKLLRDQVSAGRVGFGINHEMRDFRNDRKKDLDLVLCTPTAATFTSKRTLVTVADYQGVELTAAERSELMSLPTLREVPVGTVLVALEAKACMTAHQRALPRLYDELNSSHQTVHGSHDNVIAAGFVMVNAATNFLSPNLNKKNRATDPEWSKHDQPKSVNITVDKIRQLPRRSKPGMEGYDALSIVVIDCANDGSPVKLVTSSPAPPPQDTYHYATMIDRLAGLYATRFSQL